jgi:hypothetical protein
MRITYSLVGLTVATGTMLIIFDHANILSTCISGLLYVGAVSVGLVIVSRRLASQKRQI